MNHEELITQAATAGDLTAGHAGPSQAELDETDLGNVFGIELETLPTSASAPEPVPQDKPARPQARSRKSTHASKSRARGAKSSKAPGHPAASKPGKGRRPVAKKK